MRDKIGGLGPSINDPTNRVVTTHGGRQTNNKVHGNVFPLSSRNIYPLRYTSRMLVLILHMRESQASKHKICNSLFHFTLLVMLT